MDVRENPFALDAAWDPATAPQGRTAELALVDALVDVLAAGGVAEPLVFAGRAGVGVSTLLAAAEPRAAERDWYPGIAVAQIDVPLREVIAQAFAAALRAFAARRPGAAGIRSTADAIAAFCPHAIDALPVAPTAGVVDAPRGDLGRDLRRLLARTADGLRDLVGRGLLVVIDDLHRAATDDAVATLDAFADAMRDGQPVGLVAGGTPTVRHFAQLAGFAAHDVAPLAADDVAALVRAHAGRAGGDLGDDAIAAIVAATAGYPQLVLTYSAAAWEAAAGGAVQAGHVEAGAAAALARLATSVLEPAFAVAPAARRYLRAVALAVDPVDSTEIAQQLGDTNRFGRGASEMARVREDLVRAGLLADLDGRHVSFVHPAGRSYVLTWA